MRRSGSRGAFRQGSQGPAGAMGNTGNSTNSRALVAVQNQNEANVQQAFAEGFDKRDWLQQLKGLKRDHLLEDRDRFRPLIKLKKEQAVKDFLEEVERIEKKQEIGLMREHTIIQEFVEKQKQDVDCARTMIKQSKTDSSYLDRIQGKCQMIEQNLKNFKLKSRATYQKLAEEEQ